MRVKEGSKIHNLLRFATARMEAEDANKASQRQVVFSGSGGGVTKTITCVELMKRRIGGLHQVSKLHYKTVTEIWERTQQGVPGLSVKKTVPAIWILLSKDPLDAQEPGYQPPQTLRVPAEDGERGLRMLLQPALALLASRSYSHGKQETDEEFDARWVTYFNKPDIDAWELKKGMNTLIGYDLVPEPKILEAALRACRRLNDLASAIRILEAVKDKAGPHKEIYPYVIQELRPTLDELGISTPEELGIDKL
ncbi:Cytochrome c oxidase subunit 5A, mitochondrial [Takifugu flavidus]|uniref:Cytochrome c oxidase subunit 5A, mitochondrial n=1 Tax=Takifugu flavidus TaxID=433684 RepID=A0A5C6PB44_9TELE|nr:Cytochrome c oxidase subunit 5A, mitochondrial [Takifugu flavidus]